MASRLLDTVAEPTPGRPRISDLRVETLGRVRNLELARARYAPAQLDPILDSLLARDELAVDTARELKGRRGWQQLVHTAIAQGIEHVEDPPEPLARLFAQVDHVPEWVDWAQLERGSVAYWRAGPLVSFAFTCAAVAGGEGGNGVTRPLAMTGRFGTRAYTRSLETFRWLMAATRPGGMRRNAPGFELSVWIRLLHGRVSLACEHSPKWDLQQLGVPICHADNMYSLAYSFAGVMPKALGEIGMRFTDQEVTDIFALWRYIGYVLGIPDHLCPRSLEQAQEWSEIWRLLDLGPDEICRKLVHSLIDLATTEETGGEQLEVFPKLVTTLLPPLRLRALMYGLMRFWCDRELCDALEVPDTRWKHAGHVIRPGVLAWEAARAVRTRGDAGRRAALDLRTAERTLEFFAKPMAVEEGGEVLAPADGVEQAVAA